MRIGLNLLYLIPGQVGGTQTYGERLVRALASAGTEHEYYLFVNAHAAALSWPDLSNFHKRVCEYPARSRAARYAFEQLELPRRLTRERVQLLHSLGYVSPLRPPCASVVSIHDAISVGYPFSPFRRAVLEFFVGRSARISDHVLTMSNYSKREIIRHYHVRPERVTVAPLGPRELPVAQAVPVETLSRLYGIDQPYIAAFGGVFKHKNLSRLVTAFAAVAAAVPHKLLLIGRLPPDGEVQREIERHSLGHRVVLTGYVPDDHVMPLLERAAVFAFPSWYEGFGLPVLDAQRARVPVACSRAASLPEVAGDAAEFFDPFSVEQIAQALRMCILDDAVRNRLVERGVENVRRFSWEKTARTTLDVYESVALRRRVAGTHGASP